MDDYRDSLLFGPPVDFEKSAEPFERYIPVVVVVKTASDRDSPFTIAVDLDGTLAEKEEPFNLETIGKPRKNAKKWMDAFHDAGARLIIFTVRGGESPVAEWLKANEMPYDYINENPDQPDGGSGKVIADAYWDDRAYSAADLEENGPKILQLVEESGKSEDKTAGDAQSWPDPVVMLGTDLLRALRKVEDVVLISVP